MNDRLTMLDSYSLNQSILLQIQAHMTFQEALKQDWDAVVLPGGEQGATTMRDTKELIEMLQDRKDAGKLSAASGCSPSIVFASIPDFLDPGATCYPLNRLREVMPNATDNDVVLQENVVTCQGIGPCLIFALILAELLLGPSLPAKVSQSMLVDRTGLSGFRYSPEQANPKNRLRKNSNKSKSDEQHENATNSNEKQNGGASKPNASQAPTFVLEGTTKKGESISDANDGGESSMKQENTVQMSVSIHATMNEAATTEDGAMTETTNQQEANLDSAATNTTNAANYSEISQNGDANAKKSALSGDDDTNMVTSKQAPPVQAKATSECDGRNPRQSTAKLSSTAKTSEGRHTNGKPKHVKTAFTTAPELDAEQEMSPSKVVQQREDDKDSTPSQPGAQLSSRGRPKERRPPPTRYLMTTQATEERNTAVNEKISSLSRRRTVSSSGQTETLKSGSSLGTKKRLRKGDSYKSTSSAPTFNEATQPVRKKRKRGLEVLFVKALSEVASYEKAVLGSVRRSFFSTGEKYMNDILFASSNREEVGVKPLNEAFERALSKIDSVKNQWCVAVEKSCLAKLENGVKKWEANVLEKHIEGTAGQAPRQTTTDTSSRVSSRKARIRAQASDTDEVKLQSTKELAQNESQHPTAKSGLSHKQEPDTLMPRKSDTSVAKARGGKLEVTPLERWQSQETTGSTIYNSVSKALKKVKHKESQKFAESLANVPESGGEAKNQDKGKEKTKRRTKQKIESSTKRNRAGHVKPNVSEALRDRVKERMTPKVIDKDPDIILHQIQASDRRASPPQLEADAYDASNKDIAKRDPQKRSTHPKQPARKSRQQDLSKSILRGQTGGVDAPTLLISKAKSLLISPSASFTREQEHVSDSSRKKFRDAGGKAKAAAATVHGANKIAPVSLEQTSASEGSETANQSSKAVALLPRKEAPSGSCAQHENNSDIFSKNRKRSRKKLRSACGKAKPAAPTVHIGDNFARASLEQTNVLESGKLAEQKSEKVHTGTKPTTTIEAESESKVMKFILGSKVEQVEAASDISDYMWT
jgi:hypothetical protein